METYVHTPIHRYVLANPPFPFPQRERDMFFRWPSPVILHWFIRWPHRLSGLGVLVWHHWAMLASFNCLGGGSRSRKNVWKRWVGKNFWLVWNIFSFSIYWEYSFQPTFIFFRGVAQPLTRLSDEWFQDTVYRWCLSSTAMMIIIDPSYTSYWRCPYQFKGAK